MHDDTTTTATTATDAVRLLAVLEAGAAQRRDLRRRLHWTEGRLEAAVTAAGAALRAYETPVATARWLALAGATGGTDTDDGRATGGTDADAERFAALAKLQPRLAVLAEGCRLGHDPRVLRTRNLTYVPPTAFCKTRYWQRCVQPLLPDIVGSTAKGYRSQLQELALESSYDLVVDHLHALLPACNHPGSPCGR